MLAAQDPTFYLLYPIAFRLLEQGLVSHGVLVFVSVTDSCEPLRSYSCFSASEALLSWLSVGGLLGVLDCCLPECTLVTGVIIEGCSLLPLQYFCFINF